MEVKQISELLNEVASELLGKSDLVQEDLSNVVEIGKEFFSQVQYDNYVKALNNKIGKMVFNTRVYDSKAPKVLMDNWRYGSITEVVDMDLPEVYDNESWKLQNGVSVDNQIFYQPKVSTKLYNDIVSFEIPMSFTERQVMESFNSINQLNSFITMIYNAVDNAMKLFIDSLIMRTINNYIACVFENDIPDNDYQGNSTTRCVNLLKLYNDTFAKQLTNNECKYDREFLRFATTIIDNYKKRLGVYSTLFNISGKQKFTPQENLHFVVINEFANNIKTYLESDTYHKDLVSLPKYEEVAYWQAPGNDYKGIYNINVKNTNNTIINVDNVVAVMFDENALGVSLFDRRTTTSINARGEYTTNYVKCDGRYFNNFNENFVVFYVESAF